LDAGQASLQNCTLSTNYVSGGLGGEGGPGGGQFGEDGSEGSPGGAIGGAVANGNGTLSLRNCILAYSTPQENASGVIEDGGANLSSDSSPPFSHATSQNEVDPLLGPLTDNGGPTRTAPLLSASPAINAGDALGAPFVDQRGFQRDGMPDIGAFEFDALLPTPQLVIRSTAEVVIISWPWDGEDYQLISSASVPSSLWETEPPATRVGDNMVTTNLITGFSRYYRLTQ